MTGEDYELAQKGFANWVKSLLFGPTPLGTVFPDISRDVAGAVARHTTQIGINPTQIVGPRFVLNIRTPPVPADLTDQVHACTQTCTHRQTARDLEGP